MTATYKTTTPKMMGQFFSEVNSEKFEREKSLFEHCHGAEGTIEVVFFKHIPGECASIIKEDGKFAKIESFNFSNYALNKQFTKRQLLVTVNM